VAHVDKTAGKMRERDDCQNLCTCTSIFCLYVIMCEKRATIYIPCYPIL